MARDLTEAETELVAQHTARLGYRPAVFPLSSGELVLLRSPTDVEYTRFQEKSTDALIAASSPKKRKGLPTLLDAQRELALAVMIVPEKLEQRRAVLSAKPALVPKFADKATELAGDDEGELEGN